MAHLNCSFYSPSLRKNAKLTVFLPSMSADDYLFNDDHPKYFEPGTKFQTLYLLHGSYGDCLDWALFANAERYAQEHCLALIIPSAENSSYLDMYRGEDYLTYITRELPAFCGKIFPLSQKREDTFIAGLSMGGYGAFRAALERPELYAAVASLSGGLDKAEATNKTEAHFTKMPENYRKATFGESGVNEPGSENDLRVLLEKRLAEGAALPAMFHTIGEDDFLRAGGEAYIAFAKEHGVEIKYTLHPGVHNWDFWNSYLLEVMDWLPLKKDLVAG